MTQQHLLRLLLLLVLLPAVGLMLPGKAQAGITCSATGSALNFGTIDPQSGNQDVTATIDYTCRQTFFISLPEQVTLCASIGTGSGGQLTPRLMSDGGGHALQFQIYTDAGRTSVWGSLATAQAPPQLPPFTVPGGFLSYGSHSGSVNVFGRVPAGQSSAVTGSYANLLGDSFLTYDHQTNSTPASCGSGNVVSFQINATATVQKACTVTATDLNFGNVADLLSLANHDGTSSVGVRCVNGTAYKIGLDDGQHAIGGVRHMAGPGGQVIQYGLYRDGGRTQHWGATPGTDTVDGTGDGNSHATTVYGRVPMQGTPSAGDYADTITVTVTY
ncbi:Csu type fimbrial protein [Rhodanobacter spathiphylli]|uniref:Spore coat protein U/FanG domain-containing protein n=1 Tax=Rhodanobacter spathiphylli B39 TaxID=1163407 RepID=I4W2Y3_9GAMM|nr:spore coat U domain-containing protein [Rhodanobacter spathiphylli]EIL93824.1 hypothetical protein UU7_06858 [Rhodanobacter spathiphylli B39]